MSTMVPCPTASRSRHATAFTVALLLSLPASLWATEPTWWAFRPLQRPAVPLIDGPASSDVLTPIDAFLLESLGADQQRFSPLASRRTRLRRAALDLLGLPPSESLRNWAGTSSRGTAWHLVVDRLLADPHYGETWGRNWLDLVRYAETDGFKTDAVRPRAYFYRDYVIRAFNEDRPYDRFVQEQLAGDELFPEDRQAIIATGFNRMWPDESNASNILLARQDALNDLTANVGNVFLGLSIGCAQCHDHKFDPIPQADFYRLQAYFAGIVLTGSVPIGSPGELRVYQQQMARWLSQTRPLREQLRKLEQPAREKAFRLKRLKFPRSVLDAVDTPAEERSTRQHQLAFWTERQLPVDEKKLLAQLDEAQQRRRSQLKQQLALLAASRPKPPQQLEAMATLEAPSGPPPTYVLAGGNHEVPLNEVSPGPLSVLADTTAVPVTATVPRPGSSGRRAALARWLTSPDHPLVARVMVNRIWQGHFGTGLVENTNDLGRQTAPPRHPRLLDWLASEFINSGWSIKHMHRLIMTSHAYLQSGRQRQEQDAIDPRPYSYFPRRRLTSERIRDAMLAASGQLDTRMFGQPVRPPLPPKFGTRYTWKESPTAGQRSRRSIYIHAKRNLPYPLLKVFDQPDMHESCACRAETTVAPQALMLLNSELVLHFAGGVADRIRSGSGSSDPTTAVRRAWQLVLGRLPAAGELNDAVTFLTDQGRLEAGSADRALLDLCHVLLNTNEFLYID